MEQIAQICGSFALVCVAVFELLQTRINRVTSEQIEDLQDQIDELKDGGGASGAR